MAAVNQVSLDTLRGGPAICAAAFIIAKPPSESRLLEIDGWEIELRTGSSVIVARTDRDLPQDELFEEGISVANEALDMAAVAVSDILVTKRPGDEFMIFRRGERSRLAIQQMLTFPVTVSAAVVVTRADGTTESPTVQMPEWAPAFRFYRLSQASNDLFEAYRNLFLALEALLDQLFPKRSNEGEKQWLVRALSAVSSRVDLAQFDSQQTSDPARSLARWFYEVRVNLFHAKQGRTYIPEVRASYSAVAAAYDPLVRLWRRVVEAFLGMSVPGGVLTNVGFRSIFENGFRDMRVAVSTDVTPVSAEQSQFSPAGNPVLIFPEAVIIREDRPGRMSVSSTASDWTPDFGPIGRTGIVTPRGEPVITSDDFGTIDTAGVDELEISFVARLFNTTLPRTEF